MLCLYCGKDLHHASHAYKHKRKCTIERGPKTKDDTDDELLAIENERVYKTLTNENDMKIFRIQMRNTPIST